MDTEVKTKNNKVVVVVVAVLAIVLAYVYIYKPATEQEQESQQIQTQKPEIPKELILGQKIEQQVALSFPDPEKVNFAQFTTTKPKEELVKFYTGQFSKDGWKINLSKQGSETVYSIIAENQNQGLIVNVILNKNPNSDTTSVAITYKKL